MNDIFKASIFVFCSLLGLMFSGSANASDIRLHWQVDQPFRFLKFQSDMRIHEMAWDAIGGENYTGSTPVSDMQSKLAYEAWWKSPHEGGRSPIREYRELRERERELYGRDIGPLQIRSGWSSLARTTKRGDISNAHCWDEIEQVYSGCRSDAGGIKGTNEYIMPKRHIITLAAKGNGSSSSCRLEVVDGDLRRGGDFFGLLDGDDLASSDAVRALELQDCSKGVKAQLAFKESYRVAVTFTSGPATGQTFEEEIEVKDKLIVSIGDSFASGEGNPDVPVELYESRAIAPYTSAGAGATGDYDFGLPYRVAGPDTYAKWLDTRCHRSMYAPPTRAAIALSFAADRHHAITFLTFACSGAEITNGLFWPQDGVECSSQPTRRENRRRFMEPQINAVVNALATDQGWSRYRGPSLGINDRFRNEELRDGAQILSFGRTGRGATRRANANLQKKRCLAWPGYTPSMSNTPEFRRSSFVRPIDVLWLSVGGNDMGFAEVAARAVLDPKPFESSSLNEMTYRLIRGFVTTKKTELNERWNRDLPGRLNLLESGLEDGLKVEPGKVLWVEYPSPFNDEDGRPCGVSRNGLNVTFLTGYRDSDPDNDGAGIGEAQSFFDRLNDELASKAGSAGYKWVDGHQSAYLRNGVCASKDDILEQVDLPRMHTSDEVWENGFSPLDLRPYADRQRYFRTLNDSYLLTHGFKRAREDPPPLSRFGFTRKLDRAIYMATRAINGAFHVTAQGNAHTADAIYCASLPVLFGEDGGGYPELSCR
ncbi:hypothetical protein [Hoeflea sp.]|uniref:hypothetical protein n=1 Tax=Hoeflea sp. TaxID=1940281 RepID=UPI003B52A36A